MSNLWVCFCNTPRGGSGIAFSKIKTGVYMRLESKQKIKQLEGDFYGLVGWNISEKRGWFISR